MSYNWAELYPKVPTGVNKFMVYVASPHGDSRSADKGITRFYGTQRSVLYSLKSPLYSILSQLNSLSVWVLSSHLGLGFQNRLFASSFQTETPHECLTAGYCEHGESFRVPLTDIDRPICTIYRFYLDFFESIRMPLQHQVESINHGAPYYTIFFMTVISSFLTEWPTNRTAS
jgi:hypothetical protein